MKKLESSLGIAQNTYNELTKGISKNMREKYEAEIDVLLLTLKIHEKNRNDYEIYADIEGIVTELNTFQGDTPTIGSMIIEIQDPTEKSSWSIYGGRCKKSKTRYEGRNSGPKS